MFTLAELLDQLKNDPWRETHPFSTELNEAGTRIVSALDKDAAVAILAQWLARYQPCLFGRIAAKRGLLSYCVLDESDLLEGDLATQEMIQASRLQWTADAHQGRKSGFVILLRSERIALATPDAALLAVGKRLASLYLLEDVQPGRIYLDEIFLEAPGTPPRAWKWPAGVNFFGSQADGRWWHDHRIPGGVAFSVNSIGHMVKSGVLADAMAELEEKLGLDDQGEPIGPVDSLPKALEFAMRTIALAANTPWGPATELLPRPPNSVGTDFPVCPVHLPTFLADKNHCEYSGWYHTDQTLPDEYFIPSPERSPMQRRYSLDFTYLFHDSLENPDHRRLGQGVRIRTDSTSNPDDLSKRARAREVTIEVRNSPRLAEALVRHKENSA